MNPHWQVNKTKSFIDCVIREKISNSVIEGLELLVETITLTETKNKDWLF